MTRAGSKLVLRTSPAPGHYLCIKWDFASPRLRAAALRIYKVTIAQTFNAYASAKAIAS